MTDERQITLFDGTVITGDAIPWWLPPEGSSIRQQWICYAATVELMREDLMKLPEAERKYSGEEHDLMCADQIFEEFCKEHGIDPTIETPPDKDRLYQRRLPCYGTF